MTLLDKALKLKARKPSLTNTCTPDHVQLVMAWLKNEITGRQFSEALGSDGQHSNNAYSLAASILKGAVNNGLITITMK